jgi:hypothetical protein
LRYSQNAPAAAAANKSDYRVQLLQRWHDSAMSDQCDNSQNAPAAAAAEQTSVWTMNLVLLSRVGSPLAWPQMGAPHGTLKCTCSSSILQLHFVRNSQQNTHLTLIPPVAAGAAPRQASVQALQLHVVRITYLRTQHPEISSQCWPLWPALAKRNVHVYCKCLLTLALLSEQAWLPTRHPYKLCISCALQNQTHPIDADLYGCPLLL